MTPPTRAPLDGICPPASSRCRRSCYSTFLSGLGFVVRPPSLLRDNRWPLVLSVPVLAFLCAYSYTKRFTALAHFWLGVSLLLAPVSAWIAIRRDARLAGGGDPLLLGGAVLFWVAGFDILYACQDAAFDRAARLRSVPAALGVANSLRVAAAAISSCSGMLLALGQACDQLGWIYNAGVAAVAVLLAWGTLARAARRT